MGTRTGIRMEQKTPHYYIHSADTDSCVKAVQALYETVWISKGILICVNDAEVAECSAQLNDMNFTTLSLTASMMDGRTELRPLAQFKKSPNPILLITLEAFQKLDDGLFYQYIMESQWNALIGNNVPSYHLDAIADKIQGAHRRGFWNDSGNNEDFHLMYYLN